MIFQALLVDMEDGVVSRFKNGPLKYLFDEKFIISSYPGSGNNWAKGYYYHGPNYKEKFLDAICRLADSCNNLQGFLLLFSVGGGTGSGVGSYILKILADHYPFVDRFVICIYPTGTEDVVTCPYNMALCTKKLSEFASCVFPVENRVLLDIVNRQLKNVKDLDTVNFLMKCKPFQDMNRIVVNMLLHLTR